MDKPGGCYIKRNNWQKQLAEFSLICEILKVVLRNSGDQNDHQDWQLGRMHTYEYCGKRI